MKGTVVVICALVATAWANSSGAPESVCDDMTPQHPADPQKSELPYTVAVSKKEVKKGDVITITIGGKSFKGFLIEVRNGGKAVGTFDIPANDEVSKTINCHGIKGSTATHKTAAEKKEVTLKWKAPDAPGDLQVYVTIAENGGVFWARKATQKIKVN